LKFGKHLRQPYGGCGLRNVQRSEPANADFPRQDAACSACMRISRPCSGKIRSRATCVRKPSAQQGRVVCFDGSGRSTRINQFFIGFLTRLCLKPTSCCELRAAAETAPNRNRWAPSLLRASRSNSYSGPKKPHRQLRGFFGPFIRREERDGQARYLQTFRKPVLDKSESRFTVTWITEEKASLRFTAHEPE
jgi:hypothetical protein